MVMLRNETKLYIYRALASFSLVYPVWVLYLIDNGLSMTQVMVLQAVFTGGTVLFNIPAGILADRIGRKPVILISTAMFSLAHAFYFLSDAFWEFFLCEVLFAASIATWESTYQAFLYESLLEEGREKHYKKSMGNVFAIAGASLAAASIIGGILAPLTRYGLLFLFTAGFIAAGFFVQLFFREPAKQKAAQIEHLGQTVRYVLGQRQTLVLLLYSAALAALFFGGFFMFQPYVQGTGIPLSYIGLVFAMIAVLQGLGSRYAEKLENLFGERRSLAFVGVFPAAVFVVMAFSTGWAAAFLPSLAAFAYGFKDPLMSDQINKRTGSHHRATVLSLGMFAFSVFSLVIMPVAGAVADRYGLRVLFAGLGLFMALSATVLARASAHFTE